MTTRQEHEATNAERVAVVVDLLRADCRALDLASRSPAARRMPRAEREIVEWVVARQREVADRAASALDSGMPADEILDRISDDAAAVRSESLVRIVEARR